MPTDTQRASLSTEDSIYGLLTRRVALWLRKAPCVEDDLHAARTIDLELARLGSVIDISRYNGLRERLLRSAYPPAQATGPAASGLAGTGAPLAVPQAPPRLNAPAVALPRLARATALG